MSKRAKQKPQKLPLFQAKMIKKNQKQYWILEKFTVSNTILKKMKIFILKELNAVIPSRSQFNSHVHSSGEKKMNCGK